MPVAQLQSFASERARYALRVRCKTSRQVVETDERTAEMEERLVDVRTPLIAHGKPPVAGEPGERPLYHPPVTAELLAGVHPAPGDAPLDAAPPERFPAPGEVVAFVRVQLLRALPRSATTGALDRLDGVHHLLEDPRVVDVGRVERYRERDALAVGNKMALQARLAANRRVLADPFVPLLRARSPSPSTPSSSRSDRLRQGSRARPGAGVATPRPPASRAASASRSSRTRSPSPWGASPTGCRS
jgi:hypothetical protein